MSGRPELIQAPWNTAHIFMNQAEQMHIGIDSASAALSMQSGNGPLRNWLNQSTAGGLRPYDAMVKAAGLTETYASATVSRQDAQALLRDLEASRTILGVMVAGRVLDDISLRRSPLMSPPAQAFAEVITRACRVLTDICDDGATSGAEAKAAGARLSTRQAVELMGSRPAMSA